MSIGYASIDQAVLDENGNPLYGLSAELYLKKMAKKDAAAENECRQWIEAVTGERFKTDNFAEALKDGQLLCKLMNKLNPGCIKNINTSNMAFKKMENINNFLTAAQAYGVPAPSSFMTVDLIEEKNIPQVVICLQTLGGVAQAKGFKGPVIGAKMAEKNERQFSEEVLLQSKYAVPALTANANKGASQAGTRSIKAEVVKVHDTGSTNVMSKQTMGSYGGATQAGTRSIHAEVVKVHDTGSTNVMSKQTMGSYGGATQAGTRSIHNEVVKVHDTGATNVVSKQTMGSYGGATQAGTRSIHNEVVKIQPSSPSTSGSGSGIDMEALEKLAALKDKGIITEEEFQAKKRQILGL